MADVNRLKRLENYFDRLWPITRSIAGPGFRRSLDIISEIMPTERHDFSTGNKIFDWEVPREWYPREGYFIGPNGRKYADFSTNNLHLLSHCTPFSGVVDLAELKKHLYTHPSMINAIPYLTSYYEERWGFCITQEEYDDLPEGDYQVHIDTELKAGAIEIGERVLKGESDEEILFSSYLCHPSLANNELSGPLVLAFLYELVAAIPNRRYTYRFVVVPETIGAICLLKLRGQHFKNKLIAGYQITCVGDAGAFTYKESCQKEALSDRLAKTVLSEYGDYRHYPFNPAIGSDERQYCSPGFRLPIGSVMRTMYTEYPEYHSSLDNKSIICFESLSESVDAYFDIVQLLEANRSWKNTVPYGEPQLGRRGVFRTLGSQINSPDTDLAMWWILNLADGEHDVIAIAEQAKISWKIIAQVADKLSKIGLLE